MTSKPRRWVLGKGEVKIINLGYENGGNYRVFLSEFMNMIKIRGNIQNGKYRLILEEIPKRKSL